jgi:hypothetical protein
MKADGARAPGHDGNAPEFRAARDLAGHGKRSAVQGLQNINTDRLEWLLAHRHHATRGGPEVATRPGNVGDRRICDIASVPRFGGGRSGRAAFGARGYQMRCHPADECRPGACRQVGFPDRGADRAGEYGGCGGGAPVGRTGGQAAACVEGRAGFARKFLPAGVNEGGRGTCLQRLRRRSAA